VYTVVSGIATLPNPARSHRLTDYLVAAVCRRGGRGLLVYVFDEISEGGTVEQDRTLERSRDYLREAGVGVELEGGSGDPAGTILSVARREDAGTILSVARRRWPGGRTPMPSWRLAGTTRPPGKCCSAVSHRVSSWTPTGR
jgi:hypothetical protein